MNLQSKSMVGFSLFEMAIALTILSILVASIFTLIPVRQEQENIDEINNTLTRIQQALNSFYNQNGYLPCPAPLTALFTDVSSQIGKSQDCTAASPPSGITSYSAPGGTIWIGAIPTRTLNLPDSFMFDSWNNRIEYGVVKALAQNESNYNALTTSGSFFVIEDSFLNQINTDSFSATNPKAVNIVAYTLFSHGKDGSGATNEAGTTKTCPTNSDLDKQNCQNTNLFMDANYNSSSNAYYDDYIRWKTNQQQNRDGSLGGGSGNGINSTANINNYTKYAKFVDKETFITNGGTASALTWQTRTLNTVVTNGLDSASLSSNQITLGAGTYYISASAPCHMVDRSKLRIYNATTNSTIEVGQAIKAHTTNNIFHPEVTTMVTFNSTTTIQLDHYTESSEASDGLGISAKNSVPNNFIYFATMEIWQIS